VNIRQYFKKLLKKKYMIDHIDCKNVFQTPFENFNLGEQLDVKDGPIKKQLSKKQIEEANKEAKDEFLGHKKDLEEDTRLI